jgi:hypothetical protein
MLILTDTQPRGLGYYEIDNRMVDAPMPFGSRHFEADTYTCSHCNAVVIMNPARTRERYKCNGCSHHVCDDCAAKRVAGAPCKTMQQVVGEIQDAAVRQPDHPALILP